MQQHGSNYFACRRPLDQGSQKVKILLFQNMVMMHIKINGITNADSTLLGHGNAVYQINGNHKCSNMVANILPADPHPPPPTLGWAREHGHVAYKLNGISNAATW